MRRRASLSAGDLETGRDTRSRPPRAVGAAAVVDVHRRRYRLLFEDERTRHLGALLDAGAVNGIPRSRRLRRRHRDRPRHDRRAPAAAARGRDVTRAAAGDTRQGPAGYIHSVAHGEGVPAVSIHCYSPPLMKVGQDRVEADGVLRATPSTAAASCRRDDRTHRPRARLTPRATRLEDVRARARRDPRRHGRHRLRHARSPLGARVAVIEPEALGGTESMSGASRRRPWSGPPRCARSAAGPRVRRAGRGGDRRPRGHGPDPQGDRRRAAVLRGAAGTNGVLWVRGKARFRGGDSSSATTTARDLRGVPSVLAVGARPWIAPIPGLEAASSSRATICLGLTDLPASLVIGGAGPIAVEFTQALDRLGVEVTLVLRSDAPLRGEEPEAARHCCACCARGRARRHRGPGHRRARRARRHGALWIGGSAVAELLVATGARATTRRVRPRRGGHRHARRRSEGRRTSGDHGAVASGRSATPSAATPALPVHARGDLRGPAGGRERVARHTPPARLHGHAACHVHGPEVAAVGFTKVEAREPASTRTSR